MSSNKLDAEERELEIQKKLLAELDTSKFTAHKLTVE